jgi:hypothetical protein
VHDSILGPRFEFPTAAWWGHEDSAVCGEQRRIHPEAEDSSLGVGPVLGQGGLLVEENRVDRRAGRRGRKEREEKGWVGWAKTG